MTYTCIHSATSAEKYKDNRSSRRYCIVYLIKLLGVYCCDCLNCRQCGASNTRTQKHCQTVTHAHTHNHTNTVIISAFQTISQLFARKQLCLFACVSVIVEYPCLNGWLVGWLLSFCSLKVCFTLQFHSHFLILCSQSSVCFSKHCFFFVFFFVSLRKRKSLFVSVQATIIKEKQLRVFFVIGKRGIYSYVCMFDTESQTGRGFTEKFSLLFK